MAGRKTLPPEDRFAVNIIENSRNEVLLLKRCRNTRLGPGLWGFPAGHIETNESAEQSALRELAEEVGTNNKLEKIRELGPIRDTFYGGKFEIWLFHYKWLHGTVLLNHEHTDFAWVSKQRFKNYAVMDGVDEDIFYLGIWPKHYLRQEKLPANHSSDPILPH
ncbi:MAG: NUDIX hydrolase [Gammaproteobacteria bacterium]